MFACQTWQIFQLPRNFSQLWQLSNRERMSYCILKIKIKLSPCFSPCRRCPSSPLSSPLLPPPSPTPLRPRFFISCSESSAQHGACNCSQLQLEKMKQRQMKELRSFVSNVKHELNKSMKQLENQKDSQISVLNQEITTLKAQVREYTYGNRRLGKNAGRKGSYALWDKTRSFWDI